MMPSTPISDPGTSCSGPDGAQAGTERVVFVIEDHALTRQGIGLTLAGMDGIAPGGEAATVEAARDALPGAGAHIAVLDLELPGTHGLALLAELRGRHGLAVVVLSGTSRHADFATALRLGANAVVSKSDPPSELVAGLRAAEAGHTYISAALRELIALDAPSALPPRQAAILVLLEAGESNKEIAYRLGIAPPTVSFHLGELRARIGAESNRKIVPRARELRLI